MDGTYIPKYHLETHADVETRVRRGRSTLYAMRDEKDARYDPTFPEPVPVGPPSNPYSAIRFAAHEVDEWIESRMAMRPGRQLCPRCTNTTDHASNKSQCTSPFGITNPGREPGE